MKDQAPPTFLGYWDEHGKVARVTDQVNGSLPSDDALARFEIERLNAVILAHIENENKLYGEIRSLRALKAERPKIKDREPRHITIEEPDIKKD